MSAGRVAAIGEQVEVEGFGLAGVLVCAAENADEVRAAWAGLPSDVAVVILTRAAAEAVPDRAPGVPPLTVVMPG